MPAETFSKPIAKMLDGKCDYEYYIQNTGSFTKQSKSRICHIMLDGCGEENKNILAMIFTIRNQLGQWKIHSEGAKRTDPGATVPLRNTAIKLAHEKGWKYFSLAVAGEDTPSEDIVSEYVVSIESYTYGNETVCVLTNILEKLGELGKPNFYRCVVNLSGNSYTLSFIKRDKLVDYLRMFDNRSYDNNQILDKLAEYSGDLDGDANTNSFPGYNKIFYGIPGCGKSWHIENKVLADVNKKEDVFRTTFFLDYSNSDFVGQIYPVVDGDKVKYEYVPGPFTKALERALTVEDGRMVYLVIEEINRGNAAAIFGDLFQLLDRLSRPRDGRVKGDSEYPISNTFIEGYFEKHGVPFDKGNIYIPHNMTILATMNTSDQNVFPLDTAFQRRWDREKVVAKIEESKYADLLVPGTEIKWKDFASKINIHMIEDCNDKSITEDKNLGAYFATDTMLCYEDDAPEVKKEKAVRFANNVMEYLFGTAVKFAPEILFDRKYDRYQKVYDEMESYMFDVDQSEAFISMLAKNLREDIKETINASPASVEDGE